MRILFAIGIAGVCCSTALAQQAEPAPSQATALPAAVPHKAPAAANDRLPLPTDTGVAWDKIDHRANIRWECRAVPSGKFVMTSLCANLPKVDSRWPGTGAPPDWDGMVHGD